MNRGQHELTKGISPFLPSNEIDFHMLVEDSDSTVASNPSSTGADMMHVSLEYPGKDSKEK